MLALGEVLPSLVRHIPKYLVRYFTNLVFVVYYISYVFFLLNSGTKGRNRQNLKEFI